MEKDPYAPPTSITPPEVLAIDTQDRPLATLGQRLHGSLLDSVFVGFWTILVCVALNFLIDVQDLANSWIVDVVFLALLLGLNTHHMRNSSQTFGKRLARTVVIDHATRRPASFRQQVVRHACFSPLILLGSLGDWIGLFSVFLIFTKDRRTLSDYIAQTAVVSIDPLHLPLASTATKPALPGSQW